MNVNGFKEVRSVESKEMLSMSTVCRIHSFFSLQMQRTFDDQMSVFDVREKKLLNTVFIPNHALFRLWSGIPNLENFSPKKYFYYYSKCIKNVNKQRTIKTRILLGIPVNTLHYYYYVFMCVTSNQKCK